MILRGPPYLMFTEEGLHTRLMKNAVNVAPHTPVVLTAQFSERR